MYYTFACNIQAQDGTETEEELNTNIPEDIKPSASATDTTNTCTESSQYETDAEWDSMHQTTEEALAHASTDDDKSHDEETEEDTTRNNIR